MTDSMDKKSKEKHDKFNVDLDALLDEAESSMIPLAEFQVEEDAIDRLLMSAGFDESDMIQDKRTVVDATLGDFSDFNDVKTPTEDFDEVAMTIAVDDDEVSAEETLEDIDVIDPEALLVNGGFDKVAVVQDESIAEAMAVGNDEVSVDDFSDFSDFIDPEMLLVDDDFDKVAEVQDESVAETMAVVNGEVSVDDFSDFSDFIDPEMLLANDDFDKVAVTQDETVTSTVNDNVLDDFADLSDFNTSVEILLNEDDSFGLSDDTEISDMIQDEAEASLSDVEFQVIDDEEGFGHADERSEQAIGNDELNSDDLSELDDFFQLNKVSADFSRQIEDQLAEADMLTAKNNQEDDFLLPDFDITSDLESSVGSSDADISNQLEDPFADADFLSGDDALQDFGSEAIADDLEKKDPVTEIADEDAENTELDALSSEQRFEQQGIKKQLEDAGDALKKAKLLAYVALSFGVVAIVAAVSFGVISYGAKSEVTKLTEVVSNLQASLANIAENDPHEEINAMSKSVIQLNRQLDGFIAELKGSRSFPLDMLDNKVPDIQEKQYTLSKALTLLQDKMGKEIKLFSAEPSKIESGSKTGELAPIKIDALHTLTKEEVAHEPVMYRKEPVHELIKEKAKPEVVAIKEKAKLEVAPVKVEAKSEVAAVKVEAKSEAAPVKVEAKPEVAAVKVEAKPEATPVKLEVKPEVTAAKVQTEAISTKSDVIQKAVSPEEVLKLKSPEVVGNWGVNLLAFKQEWFAKSKAAEFARQGIFADVVPVPGNMYRLRVGGFKTKAEANANKGRIQSALNLSSVWVSDN